MNAAARFQIGEVADAVGLSIRTIRHYDELAVVEPSARSAGGFRLYTGQDIERLRLVKNLKPLQFSLEEIQELVALHHRAASGTATPSDGKRLADFASVAYQRCEELRQQLQTAESAARQLTSGGPRHPRAAAAAR